MESRIRTALWLYAFGAIGLFLLVAPWTAVWTQAVAGLLPTTIGRAALLGPVRARVDYRVFNLRGEPLHATVHRVYAGFNLNF